MKAKYISTVFIALGLLLVAAALCLIIWNFSEEARATKSAYEALREIRAMTTHTAETGGSTEAETEGMPQATLSVPDTAETEEQPGIPPVEETTERLPAETTNEMPTSTVNAQEYIGVIEIPSLELSLPIISEWTYPRLKLAPCRYQGSVYSDDLIIMGHNYKGHFGSLLNIGIGDELYFTDFAENVFAYEVIELVTLDGNDVEGMVSGDWDLTLFTCTLSGQTRVTVRCARISESVDKITEVVR